MRKLIYSINLSIDGCCDHTKFSGDEETHDFFTNLIKEADLLVYGRKTYELMVPFWPEMAKNRSGQTRSMNEFAQIFDSTPKLVFSHSLRSVEDKNSRLLHSNLENEIRRLKQEPGGYILAGGVDLPSQLIKAGLVDEFIIVVQPALVGEGRRLFDNIELEKLELKLTGSKPFRSGAVALRYLKQ